MAVYVAVYAVDVYLNLSSTYAFSKVEPPPGLPIGLDALRHYVDGSFRLPKNFRASNGAFMVPEKWISCFAAAFFLEKTSVGQFREALSVIDFRKALVAPRPSMYCKEFKYLFKYFHAMGLTNNQSKEHERISLVWHYSRCSADPSSIEHCPNPCNSNPCVGRSNVTGHCVHYFDPSIHIGTEDIPKPLLFAKEIFQLNYRCECELGFYWNYVEKKCLPSSNICAQLRPCKHGECQLIAEKNSPRLVCKCSAFFTGEYCDQPIDACEGHTHCGNFTCVPDTRSTHGYRCECYGAYRPNHPFNESCVEIDKCKDLNFCLNGGTCLKSNYSFKCECREDVTGENCENYNRPIDQWSTWSPWSECSQSSGKGHQSGYRQCSTPYECSGSDSRTQTCGLNISTQAKSPGQTNSTSLLYQIIENFAIDEKSREIHSHYIEDIKKVSYSNKRKSSLVLSVVAAILRAIRSLTGIFWSVWLLWDIGNRKKTSLDALQLEWLGSKKVYFSFQANESLYSRFAKNILKPIIKVNHS